MGLGEGHIEWPDLKHYSDTSLFNTKAVVQQTGVPAPTLRAWERRYAILSPERANNDYRLYSERDIAMIRWLKERVDSGLSISQAIALFRHKSEECRQFQEMQHAPEEYRPAFYVALPTVPQEKQEEAAREKGEQKINTAQPTIQDWPHVSTEYTQSCYPATHNIRMVRESLLDAFNVLDEITASMLMASVLAIYPVEQVCTDLIVPVMWRVGQLWEEGKITVSVEHFASAFYRGLLTNLFHVTPKPNTGPLVISCCAPGEPHELASLMLALFLRRSGVRVAYLGQSIETEGLLQTTRQLAPALLCISLTMPAYLASLIDLARKLQELRAPCPTLAFGGQVFTQYAHLVSQVPGVYLDGDLKAITAELRRMAFERREVQPS